MQQLYGEYECSVDDKGRIKLPSALLRNVGGNPPYKFFVNRGFEKCLMLYPEKVWDRIVDKVNNRGCSFKYPKIWTKNLNLILVKI